MFGLMTALAQNASGYVATSRDESLGGLMTLGLVVGFAAWLAYAGIREFRQMRNEERQSHADDVYTSLDALGPTMADGGRPIAKPGARKVLRQIR